MHHARKNKILVLQVIVVLISMVVYRIMGFEHNPLGAFFIFLPLLIVSIFSVRFLVSKSTAD